jgi:hypothetical protein
MDCLRKLRNVGIDMPSLQFSGAGQADYKTDYIAAGRAWTPLDDVSLRIVDSRQR